MIPSHLQMVSELKSALSLESLMLLELAHAIAMSALVII
jgi:hypothetical protein